MKFINRFIFIFILNLIVFTPTSQALFNDVPVSHKYFEAISYLENQEVIEDSLYFRPDDYLSRQEFFQLILRNTNFRPDREINEEENPYEDVPDDSAFLPYINKAYELRLSSPVKTLVPERKINRFEVIRTIFFLEGIPIPRYLNENIKFSDVASDSYYAPYIKKAIDLNIISPISKQNFGLFSKITRGELADVLYRLRLLHEDNEYYEKSTNQKESVIIDSPNIPKLEILQEVYNQIVNNHINASQLTTADKNDLMYAAIKAMVDKLRDEYTEYLTPEEAEALKVTLNSELEGIGAYINLEDGKIIIVAPVSGSPAEKVGLKTKDIILEIDGVPTEGMSLTEAVTRIKGKTGTKVKLIIEREGVTDPLSFEVTREKVLITSVRLETQDNIAHIFLNQFSANTNSEFRKAVEEIEKIKPRGIIIDLRNNPGGYLDSAVYVLGYLFDRGTIAVQIQYADNIAKHETSGNAELKDYKIVILANKGSASAAEIVMGALIELKNSPVVGETTFGKGTVQELNYYDDGSSLKLTIAKWLTPKGNWLNHDGFIPNYEIDDDPTTEKIDEAYEKAKQVLLNM